MDLNKAMIIGRLTRDPETRTTPQGINVTSFGVATNFFWTNSQGERQEKVEYHNVVAWRKLAEICSQYLQKGRKVYIEGRIQTRTYTDKEGNQKNRTEIIAENMIMLEGKTGMNKEVHLGGNKGEENKGEEIEEKINIEEIPF